MSGPESEEKVRRAWSAAKYTAVGLEFGVSVVIGWFVGDRLDRHFGWAPWGMIVGTMLGFAAGLRTLIRAARDAERQDEEP